MAPPPAEYIFFYPPELKATNQKWFVHGMRADAVEDSAAGVSDAGTLRQNSIPGGVIETTSGVTKGKDGKEKEEKLPKPARYGRCASAKFALYVVYDTRETS